MQNGDVVVALDHNIWTRVAGHGGARQRGEAKGVVQKTTVRSQLVVHELVGQTPIVNLRVVHTTVAEDNFAGTRRLLQLVPGIFRVIVVVDNAKLIPDR